MARLVIDSPSFNLDVTRNIALTRRDTVIYDNDFQVNQAPNRHIDPALSAQLNVLQMDHGSLTLWRLGRTDRFKTQVGQNHVAGYILQITLAAGRVLALSDNIIQAGDRHHYRLESRTGNEAVFDCNQVIGVIRDFELAAKNTGVSHTLGYNRNPKGVPHLKHRWESNTGNARLFSTGRHQNRQNRFCPVRLLRSHRAGRGVDPNGASYCSQDQSQDQDSE
jgi:hypothetical protein